MFLIQHVGLARTCRALRCLPPRLIACSSACSCVEPQTTCVTQENRQLHRATSCARCSSKYRCRRHGFRDSRDFSRHLKWRGGHSRRLVHTRVGKAAVFTMARCCAHHSSRCHCRGLPFESDMGSTFSVRPFSFFKYALPSRDRRCAISTSSITCLLLIPFFFLFCGCSTLRCARST